MLLFWCDGVSRTFYGGRVWFWRCQVTLLSVASVITLASCHLIIWSICCPQYIWLEPLLPLVPVDSGLLRHQVSLWSFACGLLWTWDSVCVRVLGSQVPLRPWNTGVTKLLLSLDPEVLRSCGESSRDLGVVRRLCVQGDLALSRTGRVFWVFEEVSYLLSSMLLLFF